MIFQYPSFKIISVELPCLPFGKVLKQYIHLHLSRAGWRRWWTIVIVYDNLFHCPSDDVVIVAYNQPFLGRRGIDSAGSGT